MDTGKEKETQSDNTGTEIISTVQTEKADQCFTTNRLDIHKNVK